MSEKVRLAVALKRHAAVEGETVSQFAAELKKLTPEDRSWFAKQFKTEFDYDIEQ